MQNWVIQFNINLLRVLFFSVVVLASFMVTFLPCDGILLLMLPVSPGVGGVGRVWTASVRVVKVDGKPCEVIDTTQSLNCYS